MVSCPALLPNLIAFSISAIVSAPVELIFFGMALLLVVHSTQKISQRRLSHWLKNFHSSSCKEKSDLHAAIHHRRSQSKI